MNLLINRSKCVFIKVDYSIKVEFRREDVKEAVLRVALEELSDFILELG